MGFKFWFLLILKLFLASIKEIALKICKKEILGQPLKLSSHKVRLHLARKLKFSGNTSLLKTDKR